MSDISSPHDQFFRHTLSDIETAREFIAQFFPQDLVAKLNLKTLKGSESSFVSKELQLRIVDKLFEVEYIDNKKGYLYILQEHQSTPNKLMAFRCLQYRVCIWEHHHKKTGSYEFPPIHVAVFYHGKRQWKYSKSFLDLIESPHRNEMGAMLDDAFELIDVNRIPDEVLRKQTKLGLMSLTMKYIFKKDLLPILQKIEHIMQHLAQLKQKDYLETALIYLFEAGYVEQPQEMLNYVNKHFYKIVGDSTMTTLAQYLRAEGKLEGKLEGKQEAKLEDAREMLLRELEPQLISEITKLDIKDILAEAEKLKMNQH